MGRARVIGTSALLALAACGSGADGFDPLVDGTASTASSTASSGVPSTSRAPATTAPVATAATTAATTVAAAPTAVSLEESALAGLAEIQASSAACIQSPPTCDPSSVAMRGTPAFERFDEMIQWYATDGLAGRSLDKMRYTVESVRIGLDQASAVIVWCYADGALLVDTAGSPDEADDIIVDDAMNSRLIEGSFLLTSEGWRRKDARVLEEWRGEDRCPAL